MDQDLTLAWKIEDKSVGALGQRQVNGTILGLANTLTTARTMMHKCFLEIDVDHMEEASGVVLGPIQ